MATKKTVKPSNRKIKKYTLGGPGDFKTDSISFRNNEKLYKTNPSLQLENKIVKAVQKHGATKLTGKSPYIINDIVIEKKGGTIKSKKRKK